MNPSVTDWLTSIGTTGAVAVALGTSTWPQIRARMLRPVLTLKVGQVEPLERPVWVGASINHYLLRVRVINEGRTTAKQVRITIQQWLHHRESARHWERIDIDPTTARPSALHAALHIDVPPGSDALFDLLRWTPSPEALRLVSPEGFSIPFAPMRGSYGQHILALDLTAENAEGVHQTVGFELGLGTEPEPETGTLRPPMFDVGLGVKMPDESGVVGIGFIESLTRPQEQRRV